MTLAHSRYADLFENGYDQLLKTGYWRLKHVSREAIEQLSANVSSSGRGSPHAAVLASSSGSVNSLTNSGSAPGGSAPALGSPAGTPIGTPMHHLASHHHHSHHHLTPGTPSPLAAHSAHGHPAHHIASGFTGAAASPSALVAAPTHILNLKYGAGSPVNLSALGAVGSASPFASNGLSSTALRPITHGEEQMSILASLAMAEGAEELNTVNSLTALSASSQSIGTSSTSKTHMAMTDEIEEYSLQHAADRRRTMSAQFRSGPSAVADVHSPVGDGSVHQMRKEYQALESKFKALETDHRAALLQLEKYHSLLIASMRQDETARLTFARQAELQEGQLRHLVEKVQQLERELSQRTSASSPKASNNSLLNLSSSSIPMPSGTASPSGPAPNPITSAAILQAALAGSSSNAAGSVSNTLSASATSSTSSLNNSNAAANMQTLLQANAAAQASLAAAISAGSVGGGATGAAAAGGNPQAIMLPTHSMNAAAAAALFGLPKMSAPGQQTAGNAAAGGFPAAAAALYPRTALPWLATANGLNALNPLGWTISDPLSAAAALSSAQANSAAASSASPTAVKLDPFAQLQHIAAATQQQQLGSMLAAAAAHHQQQQQQAAAQAASAASSKASSPLNTNVNNNTLSIPAPIAVVPTVLNSAPSPIAIAAAVADIKSATAAPATGLTSSNGAHSPSSSSASTSSGVSTPTSIKAELADSTASAPSVASSGSGSSAGSAGPVISQPLVA